MKFKAMVTTPSGVTYGTTYIITPDAASGATEKELAMRALRSLLDKMEEELLKEQKTKDIFEV